MNIKQILNSPNRDDELRKLFIPKPWEHKWIKKWPGDPPTGTYFECTKCKAWDYDKKINGAELPEKTPCPVPDPIALDWNLAMKMRDEVIGRAKVGTVGFHKAMMKLSPYQDQANTGFWGIIYAQPHHYILAALLAKEGE